jgi:hypothetical protein
MRNEKAWSLIDPKPVLVYVETVDDYIVYWNGVVMTHSMALCMTMERIGVWPTPEMKNSMEDNYHRIYYANGFQTRAWDDKVESNHIYPYLKRIMKDHLDRVLEDKSPSDILNWFNYQRARQETIDNDLRNQYN